MQHGQLQRDRYSAIGTRDRVTQIGRSRRELGIVTPETIAIPAIKGSGRSQAHFALNTQIGPRPAKQIAHIDTQGGRIAQPDRRIGKRKVKVDPFGHEIFDQDRLAGQCGRIKV